MISCNNLTPCAEHSWMRTWVCTQKHQSALSGIQSSSLSLGSHTMEQHCEMARSTRQKKRASPEDHHYESFANIHTGELEIYTTKMDFFTRPKHCSLIPHPFQLLLPLVATSHHLSYSQLTSSTLYITSHQHKQSPSPLVFTSRRKHIKSNLRVSPHPHRIHSETRNAADQEVSNGPPIPPPSYIYLFSQTSYIKDTMGSKDNFLRLPNRQSSRFLLQNPADVAPMTAPEQLCADLGTYNCTDLWCLSGWRITFISIRLQTYTTVFGSQCAILSILLPCTNLGVSYTQSTP